MVSATDETATAKIDAFLMSQFGLTPKQISPGEDAADNDPEQNTSRDQQSPSNNPNPTKGGTPDAIV